MMNFDWDDEVSDTCLSDRQATGDAIDPAVRNNTSKYFLLIHYFLLVVDTFDVNGIEVFSNEIAAEAKFFGFCCNCFYNLMPSGRLKDGNVIVFLILPYLISNFHALT